MSARWTGRWGVRSEPGEQHLQWLAGAPGTPVRGPCVPGPPGSSRGLGIPKSNTKQGGCIWKHAAWRASSEGLMGAGSVNPAVLRQGKQGWFLWKRFPIPSMEESRQNSSLQGLLRAVRGI